MKKIIFLFTIFILLFSISSCENSKNKSTFNKFSEEYYSFNKNSYDAKEQLYQIDTTTTYVSLDNNKKATYDSRFIGFADFYTNSFNGETNVFTLETSFVFLDGNHKVVQYDSITAMDDKVGEVKLTNNYYVESNNTTSYKRIFSLNNPLVKTQFDDNFFMVNEYESFKSNTIYDFITIEDKSVIFSKKEVFDDYVITTESVFVLDIFYRPITIIKSASKVYDKRKINNIEDTFNIYTKSTLRLLNEETFLFPSFSDKITLEELFTSYIISL